MRSRLSATCVMPGENDRDPAALPARVFLDTNAIVALLQGSPSLLACAESAEWVGTSIVNELEFLSFAGLGDADRQLFQEFLSRVEVVGLTHDDREILTEVTALRARRQLKLPDAIVMASAKVHRAVLLTRDEQLARAAAADPGACRVRGF